jgi:hypothetical protein
MGPSTITNGAMLLKKYINICVMGIQIAIARGKPLEIIK